MTRSETTSTSRTDTSTESQKISGELSLNPIKLGKSIVSAGGGSIGGELGWEQSTAFTSSSSRTAQEQYSRYQTDSVTRTETAATGTISLGLRVENAGVSTYEIRSLGLTILQWTPEQQDGSTEGEFKTVATLESRL